MIGKPLYIEPRNPWENGYIEAINRKMRDEYLAVEIFYFLKDAQVIIEIWHQQYNTVRPHRSLDYKPPAHPAVLPRVPQNLQVALSQTVVKILRAGQ